MDKIKDIHFTSEELLREYALKKMIRYNNSNRICDESVAEHSFFVAFFSLRLAQKLNLSKKKTLKVVVRALMHDVPELFISDVPHNVKELSDTIKSELLRLEKDMMNELFPEYYDIVYEEGTIESLIVDLADAYSVKQYCLNEIELGNCSRNMADILEDVDNRCNALIEKIGEKKYAKE